ncbi:hypothetical protein IWZ03DRAFT_171690 [Phyllosticta citriasiana]|uniref:Uncharacterized protein n=1 Tax=Phyllosticta citriasiana TaxID=595635 RepID=A0ABR1KLQ9_9PEZI
MFPAKSDKAGISHEYYIELLERALSIVPYIMPKDSEITSPRLHHPTFGIDDVYLDEKYHVKSVIGRRGAWVGPLFGTMSDALKLSLDDEMLHPERVTKQLKPAVSKEELDLLSQTL